MKYRTRIYYTDSQKALTWDRWQKGETLHEIGRIDWTGHILAGRNQKSTLCPQPVAVILVG